MTDNQNKLVTFNFVIGKDLLEVVDNYRRDLPAIPARAEVVRELIRVGLRAKGYNPPPEK